MGVHIYVHSYMLNLHWIIKIKIHQIYIWKAHNLVLNFQVVISSFKAILVWMLLSDYNILQHGREGSDWYICTIPQDIQRLRESVDISVKPWVQPCYNIYVTFSKALSLGNACDSWDVVSKILRSKTTDTVLEVEKNHGNICWKH